MNKRASAQISDNEYATATLNRTEVQQRWCSYITHLSQISFEMVHLTYLKINNAVNAHEGGETKERGRSSLPLIRMSFYMTYLNHFFHF